MKTETYQDGLNAAIEKVEELMIEHQHTAVVRNIAKELKSLRDSHKGTVKGETSNYADAWHYRTSNAPVKDGHKSVTEFCAEHPNLMEYVGQLERTNDQWNRQIGEMRDYADSLRQQVAELKEWKDRALKEMAADPLVEQVRQLKEERAEAAKVWFREQTKLRKQLEEQTEEMGRIGERFEQSLAGELRKKDALRAELAAMKSPWIPAPGLPTKNDADSAVRVLWLTWCPQNFNPIIVHGGVHSPPWNWTHWMTPVLPPLPQPDPAEEAFEKWWDENYPDSLNYELARSAWNAAQQKGKS